MTSIISRSWLDVVLGADRAIFQQKRDQIKAALARHKIYRSTFSELSALTDRDLIDLGKPKMLSHFFQTLNIG